MGMGKPPKPPKVQPPPEIVEDTDRKAEEMRDELRQRAGRAASVLTGEKGLGGQLGQIGTRALLGGGGS